MGWPKRLSVDKRIVALLSASTYESFPRALRELVSNAYDADATNVQIDIDQDKNTIRVQDNGTGMTPDEFDFFLRIAGRQRSRSRTTELGRTRIGQFGIGFLAMFPFCQEIRLESTVEGSPVAFRARIPASRFFTASKAPEDLTEADIEGQEFEDEELVDRHYTRLSLRRTTRLVERFMSSKREGPRHRNSVQSWSGIERLRWELQEILPVGFTTKSQVASYVNPEPQDFSVILNGEALKANDYVEEVLKHSEPAGEICGNVRFHYAIGTSWRGVVPDEARGLRVRLHRVGVGERQLFDLGTHGRTFSRLHWLSGEVNIVKGLDEAITLDRDSFVATEDYDAMRDFFRSELRKLAFFVETVDEAKRKIKAQTSGSPRSETAPRSEVILEQVERLRKRGFEIRERERGPKERDKSEPVMIDTRARVVTVSPQHQTLRDTVTVAGTQYDVKFGNWDPGDERYKACRFRDDGTIEINQDYPLFAGSHKDVFRRLQLLILEADRNSNSKHQLFDSIQDLLLEEFE